MEPSREQLIVERNDARAAHAAAEAELAEVKLYLDDAERDRDEARDRAQQTADEMREALLRAHEVIHEALGLPLELGQGGGE